MLNSFVLKIQTNWLVCELNFDTKTKDENLATYFKNMLIQVDMLIWQPVAYIIFFFTFYPAFLPALGIEIIFTKQRHITYVISVVGNPDGQKYISIMFSNRTVIMINVFVIWWCQYYRSHATSGLFTQFNEAKKILKLHSQKFQIYCEKVKE